MSLWYEMTLPIDSRDVDGKGVCKASALLGHLQEAATQAAEHGGFSREVITREHGAFWMLTRVWYRLERPLRWEEELTIRTWHRGGRAATLYRDYDLYVGREPVGECVSAWVLARQSDRQLLRLSAIRELDNTGGGALCKDKKLSKLRLPPHPVQRHRHQRPCEQHPVRGLRLRRPGDGEAGGGDLPLPAPDRLSGGVQAGGGAAPDGRTGGGDPLCPRYGRRRQIPL